MKKPTFEAGILLGIIIILAAMNLLAQSTIHRQRQALLTISDAVEAHAKRDVEHIVSDPCVTSH